HHDPKEATDLADRIDRIKWCLWHGKADKALRRIRVLADDLTKIETAYARMKRFVRKTGELHTYVTNNQTSIPDYEERRRQGKQIATSFVESTVNTLVGKRFAKNQQMQWSKKGAHHMLQIRSRTLDGSLQTMFKNWFPGLVTNEPKNAELSAVA
ncbi:MAG: ISKra4 family transposase, partial [Geminicoccaceae bacterium]